MEIVNPVASVLRTARRFVGVREVGGSNRGPVPEFSSWLVIGDMRPYPTGGLGAPWCATSAILVIRLAIGEACPIPLRPEFSDVDKLVEWAKDNRVWNIGEPQAGDLFCIPRGDGWIHTGFVGAILDAGSIETLEGNTNLDGGPNGDGYYQRTRNVAGLGFIRWINAISQGG